MNEIVFFHGTCQAIIPLSHKKNIYKAIHGSISIVNENISLILRWEY